MSRFAGWVLIIYAVALTGYAGYQYAEIEKLQWVIRVLMSGTAH